MKSYQYLFDMKVILNDKCYKIEEERSQAKERRIKVPEVHGPKKGVDPN